MSPDDAEVTQPRVLLGRYRIERTLGRGGMGEVFLAWDELLGRPVALKRLDPQGEGRDERRRAILKEARRASRIADRRIAAIHDVVDLPDEVMLVMEYVDGVTLRQRLTEPVPLEEFWSVATQCAQGVAAAHEQGVIHRDLKPENLMLTRSGDIKILDFGIARATGAGILGGATSSDSSSLHVAGTPYYMAPEAHLGGAIDERTDVFSLGVVFYELLTGSRPFEGGTYAAVANQILNSTPRPVSEVNAALPAALSNVVAGMLARTPGERTASAREVLGQLESVRRGGEVATPPAPALRPAPTPAPAARRGLAPVWVAAIVLAVVAAGIQVWRWAGAPALPREINVAVLPPSTPGASEDFAAFALGAMDFTSNRLVRHVDTPGFQIAQLSSGVEEHVANATDARQLLGVNLALSSTLEQTPDVLRARLELRTPEKDGRVAARTIEVPATQPFEFLDRLYRESASMLKLRPHSETAAAESGVRGAGTLRFYLQGMGRLRSGTEADLRRAANDLEMACRAEPEAAAARARLAGTQLRLVTQTGDLTWLASADSNSRAALALDSTRYEPHWTRAGVLSFEKKSEPALAHYERAVALNPWDDDVVYRFARNWYRAGDREREKQIYLDVMKRRPHDWRPYWWLASWQLRDNHIDESAKTFEEMIRRAPDLFRGYSNLGALLVLKGEYARAIELLQRSVRLKPYRDAYSNLGTAYFNTRKLDESVEAYNQALQFGKADCVTWLNLGDAYFFLRARKEQAAEAFAEGVRLGREEMAKRVREGSSFDAEIPGLMSTVFPRLQQPDSARAYLARALAADSAGMRNQYYAALTTWQLGDRKRAMAWLARAVASGYPKVWLKDSPVFDEWREVAEFRALVADTIARQSQAAARNTGG